MDILCFCKRWTPRSAETARSKNWNYCMLIMWNYCTGIFQRTVRCRAMYTESLGTGGRLTSRCTIFCAPMIDSQGIPLSMCVILDRVCKMCRFEWFAAAAFGQQGWRAFAAFFYQNVILCSECTNEIPPYRDDDVFRVTEHPWREGNKSSKGRQTLFRNRSGYT